MADQVALARQAIRIAASSEALMVRRLTGLLVSIERDALAVVRSLDLTATGQGRVIRELRAREALRQSRVARDLLSMGDARGPLADLIREEMTKVGVYAQQQAVAQAVATGVITEGTAMAVMAFGTRVEPELLRSFLVQTLTTLEKVGQTSFARIEDALARGAVRGAGPRATGRLIRESVNLTRYEAERVARTVFMRANNEVRLNSFLRSGVEYLQHSAANDERTCPWCEARHGMVYRAEEQPDPTLHPNCRCVVLPWSAEASPAERSDRYFEESRAEMRSRREAAAAKPIGERTAAEKVLARHSSTTATARAPFERMEPVRDPPRPVWSPGGGWQ